MTTFGPGAMMDLLDHAVLIGGLNFWNYDKTGEPTLLEPRLRDSLIDRFRARGRELSVEAPFREPPRGDDREPTRLRGIQVLKFPEWHVCQNPKCRVLMKAGNLDFKGQKYKHSCSGGSQSETVPVRFVTACKNGHLQEFPWISFVHAGPEDRNCLAPALKLLEGASGDFSEIIVSCTCGARRALSTALVKEANPTCLGERPWLGPEGKEKCTEPMRLMVRTGEQLVLCSSGQRVVRSR